MLRKLVLSLSMLLIAILGLFWGVVSAASSTWPLQDLIDAANPWDTVSFTGAYTEDIVINKSLNLFWSTWSKLTWKITIKGTATGVELRDFELEYASNAAIKVPSTISLSALLIEGLTITSPKAIYIGDGSGSTLWDLTISHTTINSNYPIYIDHAITGNLIISDNVFNIQGGNRWVVFSKQTGPSWFIFQGNEFTYDEDLSTLFIKYEPIWPYSDDLFDNNTFPDEAGILPNSFIGVTQTCVSTEAEFQAAISATNISTIKLCADITLTNKLFVNRGVHIEGDHDLWPTIQNNELVLTASGISVENVKFHNSQNYGIQVYRASGVTLKNVEVSGALKGGILVNGSEVTLGEHIGLYNNTWGGIEVSQWSGVTETPKLILPTPPAISFYYEQNDPVIWIDGKTTNDGWVVWYEGLSLRENPNNVKNQLWFRLIPHAQVSYSITTPTSGNVVATLVDFNKPNVDITNNSGAVSYTFTSNGSFTFELEDEYGNTGSVLATVNWITPPSSGGGGGGSWLIADTCPDGDYSPSAYDGECGEKPVIDLEDETIGETGEDTELVSDNQDGSQNDDEENNQDNTSIPDEAGDYFTDIANSFARAYINTLASLGIINGYDDDTYRPENSITRAEYLKMVLRWVGVDYDGVDTDSLSFSDVEQDTWVARAVVKAWELGIIDTTNTLFRPNDSITREESMKILLLAAGVELLEVDTTEFADVSGWSLVYIETAKSLGIVSGQEVSGNLLFRPLDSITRAEVAKIINNVIDLLAE